MTTLIFATNNPHKVEEMKAAAGAYVHIVSLKEAGITIEIPEPFETLAENAAEKSRAICALTGKDCFSEDSGLEVAALAGEPGVKSARYAGERASAEENVSKLLMEMDGIQNRAARFCTVISLRIDDKAYTFEGVCEGTITHEASGGLGFGYDPVFIPDHETRTFAEMSLAEKGRFSHRSKACDKLVIFLQQRQHVQRGHAKTSQ